MPSSNVRRHEALEDELDLSRIDVKALLQVVETRKTLADAVQPVPVNRTGAPEKRSGRGGSDLLDNPCPFKFPLSTMSSWLMQI